MTEIMKMCSGCGTEFPATTEYFDKNKNGKYGLHSKCKPCRSETARAWREANPARHAENGRQWQKEHPEKARQKSRRYRERHPDLIQDSLMQYREGHRKYFREYMRTYRDARPEYVYRCRAIRRARKADAEGHHTLSDVKEQYVAQGGRCWWCDCDLGNIYHADHVIPLSRGGSDAPDNIVVTCPACNLSKNDKLPHEWIGITP